MFLKEDRVVIVDEVDNLFIDTALNSARLSSPHFLDMSWIYEPMLKAVKQDPHLIPRLAKESLMLSHLESFMKAKDRLSDQYFQQLIDSGPHSHEKKN